MIAIDKYFFSLMSYLINDMRAALNVGIQVDGRRERERARERES